MVKTILSAAAVFSVCGLLAIFSAYFAPVYALNPF
jgi:hypothetical protein